MIDARDLWVVRNGREALRGLSLRIEAHERIAIVGPNGGGKSTLLATITRDCYPLLRPGSYLRIFGRTRWNVFALRSLLGIVSNDLGGALALAAPAREIVISGFFSSHGLARNHVVEEHHLRAAEAALARVGAAQLAERRVCELSSGEARRVLVARALVHEPKALVFDEPSASLDLGAKRELRAILRELAASGVGIVLVTHELADLVPEIERVAFLQDGRIVADGARAELLTEARLGALFGAAVRLVRDGESLHAI
ncbi:MAG: ABC transporter ATP-binding protein [Vulcanimicrobiaceae bacterium]